MPYVQALLTTRELNKIRYEAGIDLHVCLISCENNRRER